MKQFVKTVLTYVKDSLFPLYCVGCKKEGSWVCDRCLLQVETRGVFACPVCHKYGFSGRCCQTCVDGSSLRSHIALGGYHERLLLGQLVGAFKYQFAEQLLTVFEQMMVTFFREHSQLFADCHMLVPVPLHCRRFAQRGFNQATLIADRLATILQIPVCDVLVRTRATKQQALLSKQQRRHNVKDAFAIKKNSVSLDAKRCLLVDDVFTTGSTLQECARELHRSGAVCVDGFSLARG